MKGYTVRIWGDYACYSDPVLKAERYSYDVPTPSAIVGVLDSIYWHPGVHYVVRRIGVVKGGKRVSIKLNELSKIEYGLKKVPSPVRITENRVQRRCSVLRDVEYIVDFAVELDLDKMPDNITSEGQWRDKVHKILMGRLSKGRSFCQPYLGLRQFPASVELAEMGDTVDGDMPDQDFGIMFWGFDYSPLQNDQPPEALFYRASIQDGVIRVATKSEVMR